MLYQIQNPHGGDIYSRPICIDFSANTNPLGTPASVRQAVIDSTIHLNQYPDPYCRKLVTAIAAFEHLPESDILCGCGAAELIFSYCAALKPKRALELAPTFLEYASALKAVGCQVERYLLRPEKEFRLDSGFLRVLEQAKYDVVFLCNPNNPTGQTVGHSEMEQILAICHRKGIRLFVDECFLDFTEDKEFNSLKRFLGQRPEVFILKAFTKSYGMAGLRLGYGLCTDVKLLTAMGQMVQPWNISIPAQAAGIAALKEDEFLKRACQIIRTEREWLTRQLNALKIKVYPSKANYLLLYSPLPLHEKLLERGIQIRCCSNYHGLGHGWCRIAVKQHEENKRLIDALHEIKKGN